MMSPVGSFAPQLWREVKVPLRSPVFKEELYIENAGSARLKKDFVMFSSEVDRSGDVYFEASVFKIVGEKIKKVVIGDMFLKIVESYKDFEGNEINAYGDETEILEKQKRSVFITGLEITDVGYKKSGIGKAFMQIAMEYGKMHGCEGRLKLDSAFNSYRFYMDEIHMEGNSPLTRQNLNTCLRKHEAKMGWAKFHQNQEVAFYRALLEEKVKADQIDTFSKVFFERSVKGFKQAKEKCILQALEGLHPENLKDRERIGKQEDRILVEGYHRFQQKLVGESKKCFQEKNVESALKQSLEKKLNELKALDKQYYSSDKVQRELFPMYLPSRQIPKWNAQIKAKPILDKSVKISATGPIKKFGIGKGKVTSKYRDITKNIDVQIDMFAFPYKNKGVLIVSREDAIIGHLEFHIAQGISKHFDPSEKVLVIEKMETKQHWGQRETFDGVEDLLFQAAMEYGMKNQCGKRVFIIDSQGLRLFYESAHLKIDDPEIETLERKKSYLFISNAKWQIDKIKVVINAIKHIQRYPSVSEHHLMLWKKELKAFFMKKIQKIVGKIAFHPLFNPLAEQELKTYERNLRKDFLKLLDGISCDSIKRLSLENEEAALDRWEESLFDPLKTEAGIAYYLPEAAAKKWQSIIKGTPLLKKDMELPHIQPAD